MMERPWWLALSVHHPDGRPAGTRVVLRLA